MGYETRRSMARRDPGMTLVEVVIVIGLLSLLTVALYTGTVSGQRVNSSNAHRVAAFGLCKGRMEQIKGDAARSFSTVSNFPPEVLRLTHLGGKGRIQSWCTRSCQIVLTNPPDRMEVTVTVVWTNMGRPMQESLTSVIFDRGS